MKKIVIFVRHGQSTKNVQKIFTSEIENWPLTEHGRALVEAAGRELVGIKVDRMYVSPVLRARETADILSKYVHVAPVVTALLRERYAGKYENLHYNDTEELMQILHDEILHGYPEWESWKSLMDKTRKFEMMLKDAEITVAVSHGGNIKAAIGYVMEQDDETNVPDVEKLGILSASITIIDFAKRGEEAILCAPSRTLPKGLKL